MAATVPPSFLFRFAIPVARVDRLPRSGRRLLDLPPECRLLFPSALDGAARFADVRIAWNPGGLGLQVEVEGKRRAPQCDPGRPDESDGIELWIDTRNTQTIHRAGRFCHALQLMPTGGGDDRGRPVARAMPIARAREDSTLADASKIELATSVERGGWRLEAWIPGTILTGYDPDASPRLGFYCVVRDAEQGEQPLGVGREFPFAHDPSLWSTLELSPANPPARK